jgi:hypothetical protein
MGRIGEQWASLPQAELDVYEAKLIQAQEVAHKAAAERLQVLPQISLHADSIAASPLGVGDSDYPLRASFVQDGTSNVIKAHLHWVKLVGGVIGPDPRLNMRDIDCKQCSDKYGVGVCKSQLNRDVLDQLTAHRRTLWAIARLNRSTNADLDDMVLFSLAKDIWCFQSGSSNLGVCIAVGLVCSLWCICIYVCTGGLIKLLQ